MKCPSLSDIQRLKMRGDMPDNIGSITAFVGEVRTQVRFHFAPTREGHFEDVDMSTKLWKSLRDSLHMSIKVTEV